MGASLLLSAVAGEGGGGGVGYGGGGGGLHWGWARAVPIWKGCLMLLWLEGGGRGTRERWLCGCCRDGGCGGGGGGGRGREGGGRWWWGDAVEVERPRR